MRKQTININKVQGFDTNQAHSFESFIEHKAELVKGKWSRKIKIAVSVLAIAIAGVLYGYYLFNKPIESISNMDADFKMTATALQMAYENNEKASDKMYLGKVIEVTGNVQSVDTDKKGNINILLDTDNPISVVSCSIDLKANCVSPNLKPGQSIVIKGFCSGFLSDVVLVRSIIVK